MFGSTPWWQPLEQRLQWRDVEDPAALGAAIRALLEDVGPEPHALAVPRTGIETLSAGLALERRERYAQLHALWALHGPASIAPDRRVAIPTRLWDRLLARLGVDARAVKYSWIDGEERRYPGGVSNGAWTEWWSAVDAPGATFDGHLWAWGVVQEAERPEIEPSIAALTPRVAWRSDGERWLAHPLLERAVAEGSRPGARPRLEDGPGYLLACIVDAIAEMIAQRSYTGRDLAVLWGTMLLPLLAPSVEAPRHATVRRPHDSAGEEPDYMQMLPFYLLHPRIQAAVIAIDQLCTLQLAEDFDALLEVLDHVDRAAAEEPAPGGTSPATATQALIRDLARRALHRRANVQWDSGFGFKLFRSLLRDVIDVPPAIPATRWAQRWDRAVHGQMDPGTEQHSAGSLGHRLREALGTALWFPGRPPYPGGPVAQQIIDLVWLRWTDNNFLCW